MIKVLLDNVAIEVFEPEKLSKVIYATAKHPQRGIVVAVGNGYKDEPVPVSVGDRVIFPERVGNYIEHDGKKYLIMKHDNIIGIY